MDKLRNSTRHACSSSLTAEAKPQRNEATGIFQECFIVMSVKPTLTEELLKVNSALKLTFSVIEDKCSGGH